MIALEERKQIVVRLYTVLRDSRIFPGYTDTQIKEAAIRAEQRIYEGSKSREDYLGAIGERFQRIKNAYVMGGGGADVKGHVPDRGFPGTGYGGRSGSAYNYRGTKEEAGSLYAPGHAGYRHDGDAGFNKSSYLCASGAEAESKMSSLYAKASLGGQEIVNRRVLPERGGYFQGDMGREMMSSEGASGERIGGYRAKNSFYSLNGGQRYGGMFGAQAEEDERITSRSARSLNMGYEARPGGYSSASISPNMSYAPRVYNQHIYNSWSSSTPEHLFYSGTKAASSYNSPYSQYYNTMAGRGQEQPTSGIFVHPGKSPAQPQSRYLHEQYNKKAYSERSQGQAPYVKPTPLFFNQQVHQQPYNPTKQREEEGDFAFSRRKYSPADGFHSDPVGMDRRMYAFAGQHPSPSIAPFGNTQDRFSHLQGPCTFGRNQFPKNSGPQDAPSTRPVCERPPFFRKKEPSDWMLQHPAVESDALREDEQEGTELYSRSNKKNGPIFFQQQLRLLENSSSSEMDPPLPDGGTKAELPPQVELFLKENKKERIFLSNAEKRSLEEKVSEGLDAIQQSSKICDSYLKIHPASAMLARYNAIKNLIQKQAEYLKYKAYFMKAMSVDSFIDQLKSLVVDMSHELKENETNCDDINYGECFRSVVKAFTDKKQKSKDFCLDIANRSGK
jgi:hypothetical protein